MDSNGRLRSFFPLASERMLSLGDSDCSDNPLAKNDADFFQSAQMHGEYVVPSSIPVFDGQLEYKEQPPEELGEGEQL